MQRGKTSPCHSQARSCSWIYIFTTEALNRSTRLLSQCAHRSYQSCTRLGPVANTNHTLISEIEQLSSGEEFDDL
jgi:hypothetical protein